MCDSASDFSDVKVGDRLWSFDLSDYMVTIIDDDGTICCENDCGSSRWYSQDGTGLSIIDCDQSLFWSRPIAPPKPKRKVTKIVEAWAKVCNGKIVALYSINRGLSGPNIVHLTGSYEVEE